MTPVTVYRTKLDKVLTDIEVLTRDVTSLFDQDILAQQRLHELKSNPSLGKSEKQLKDYLKKRGIKVD